MKYTCPCCGYKTLEHKPPGTYEICTICFWEDDKTQYQNPDFANGINEISLKQAQKNFLSFGSSRKRFILHVKKPTSNDIKDPKWKLVDN
jgi:hypothetical protein